MRSRLLVAVLVLTAAVAGPAARADHGGGVFPRTTNRYPRMAPETALVPTRGGPVYVRIVRPQVPASKKVPVILTYTPYGALSLAGSDSVTDFFVPKGYARAIADVVGTGNSGGCFDYGGRREQASAYDLVEWLGTREWTNGAVGMIGGSYDGTTANMAAVANPPHLATIVPEVAISSWYGYSYAGGVRYFVSDPGQRQGVVIDEQGFDTPVTFDAGYSLVPSDPRGVQPDPGLADRACAPERLDHTLHGYATDPDFDEFWRERDYTADADALGTPDGRPITTLVGGGWKDWNVKRTESTRWFRSLPEGPEAPFSMMVMGQNAHATPTLTEWQTIVHAWFDRWLYDLPTNVEHQPRVWSVTNDGVLHTEASWPPPGTADVALRLSADGTLTLGAPAAPAPLLVADTAAATESRAINDRGGPDVLWFESAPLLADVRLSGEMILDATVASSGDSLHLTPVLFDLGPPVSASRTMCSFAPPQEACVVSRGFLDARYRDGLGSRTRIAPGLPMRTRISLHDNDWVIPAGHRIGLAVMSSNPWWAVPATQRTVATLFADGSSSLVLPVAGGAEAAARAGL